MEMLKRKLKAVFALVAAVVILLGGEVSMDALANGERYIGYSDDDCKSWAMTVASMATIDSEANAGRIRSFHMPGSSLCWLARRIKG